MRQAVRVGRQILLPRIRLQGKTGIQSVAASGRLAAEDKDIVPSVLKRFVTLHWDGSTWSLELLTFLPNQFGQPGRSSGLVWAGDPHVRSGVQGL